MIWKDIETAPKYDIPVLIYGGLCRGFCSGNNDWVANEDVFIGWRYKGDDYYTVDDYFKVKPTKWMELPAKPEDKGNTNDKGFDVEQLAEAMWNKIYAPDISFQELKKRNLFSYNILMQHAQVAVDNFINGKEG